MGTYAPGQLLAIEQMEIKIYDKREKKIIVRIVGYHVTSAAEINMWTRRTATSCSTNVLGQFERLGDIHKNQDGMLVATLNHEKIRDHSEKRPANYPLKVIDAYR